LNDANGTNTIKNQSGGIAKSRPMSHKEQGIASQTARNVLKWNFQMWPNRRMMDRRLPEGGNVLHLIFA
jgi:hypothetical protein